jgi:hypothetical protein
VIQNGQFLPADTPDILADPERKQPGKKEKQKQEEEYKKGNFAYPAKIGD